MKDERRPYVEPPSVKCFIDERKFELIPALTLKIIVAEYRADDYSLEPAAALDAIRRFDLSGFDWAPTNEDQFRDFLARYVPPSVTQEILQFTQPLFDEFLDAWKPDSPWCPTFMLMVAHARFGAVRAYEFLTKEEARAAKKKQLEGKERASGDQSVKASRKARARTEVNGDDAPETLASMHKGNGNIQ